MKTDDLISALARSAAPVDARRVSRQFSASMLGAVLVSLVAMQLVFGMRPDLRAAAGDPVFWVKLAFPAAAAAAALALLRRAAYPGTRLGAARIAPLAPFAAAWVLGLFVLLQAPAAERPALVLGYSWWQCALSVPLLSAPAMALAFMALRRLAPTRLALAGAAAGLFAGGVGALAYALSCTEMEMPFVATWYSLGMLLATAAGAALGPRVLRW